MRTERWDDKGTRRRGQRGGMIKEQEGEDREVG